MSKTLDKQLKISDQTEALGLYLEELFQQQPEKEIQEALSETHVSARTVKTDEIPQEKNSDGRPEWACQAFKTLFLEIDGMELAIPMEAMSGIRKYPDQLNQQSDSVPWIDGTLQLEETTMQVVNARKLFLLSNNREIDPQEQLKKPEFIVQMGDGKWGLACHSADRATMLEPDQVRWSGSERRRPWLLGMIKKHLSVLLDGDEFIKYLNESIT